MVCFPHVERKSSAYLNPDDMFSTYAQKTYMENIPCELALRNLEPGILSHICLFTILAQQYR